MTARANAKRRGSGLENRVADKLRGSVYPGQAGDVLAYDHIVECKYRRDMQGLKLLASFIDQARDNSAKQQKPWLLALSGGKGYHNDEVYVLAPLETWKRLLDGPEQSALDLAKALVRRLEDSA